MRISPSTPLSVSVCLSCLLSTVCVSVCRSVCLSLHSLATLSCIFRQPPTVSKGKYFAAIYVESFTIAPHHAFTPHGSCVRVSPFTACTHVIIWCGFRYFDFCAFRPQRLCANRVADGKRKVCHLYVQSLAGLGSGRDLDARRADTTPPPFSIRPLCQLIEWPNGLDIVSNRICGCLPTSTMHSEGCGRDGRGRRIGGGRLICIE